MVDSATALSQPGRVFFPLTINGEEAVVELPKDFPSMERAMSRSDHCWDAKLCAVGFCLSDEAIHGHVRFFYSNKKVIGLGWKSALGELRQWKYEDGVSTEVIWQEFTDFLDSFWVTPPKK